MDDSFMIADKAEMLQHHSPHRVHAANSLAKMLAANELSKVRMAVEGGGSRPKGKPMVFPNWTPTVNGGAAQTSTPQRRGGGAGATEGEEGEGDDEEEAARMKRQELMRIYHLPVGTMGMAPDGLCDKSAFDETTDEHFRRGVPVERGEGEQEEDESGPSDSRASAAVVPRPPPPKAGGTKGRVFLTQKELRVVTNPPPLEKAQQEHNQPFSFKVVGADGKRSLSSTVKPFATAILLASSSIDTPPPNTIIAQCNASQNHGYYAAEDDAHGQRAFAFARNPRLAMLKRQEAWASFDAEERRARERYARELQQRVEEAGRQETGVVPLTDGVFQGDSKKKNAANEQPQSSKTSSDLTAVAMIASAFSKNVALDAPTGLDDGLEREYLAVSGLGGDFDAAKRNDASGKQQEVGAEGTSASKKGPPTQLDIGSLCAGAAKHSSARRVGGSDSALRVALATTLDRQLADGLRRAEDVAPSSQSGDGSSSKMGAKNSHFLPNIDDPVVVPTSVPLPSMANEMFPMRLMAPTAFEIRRMHQQWQAPPIRSVKAVAERKRKTESVLTSTRRIIPFVSASVSTEEVIAGEKRKANEMLASTALSARNLSIVPQSTPILPSVSSARREAQKVKGSSGMSDVERWKLKMGLLEAKEAVPIYQQLS